jgi:hypothetical protein
LLAEVVELEGDANPVVTAVALLRALGVDRLEQ